MCFALGMHYLLIDYIRRRHPQLADQFALQRLWPPGPEHRRFLGYLLRFRYFSAHDAKLTFLALLTTFCYVAAWVLFLVRPIYWRAQQ